MSSTIQKTILAKPRGFCAGVERAILIVERALEKYGQPVYVRHEVVHNRLVVEQLKKKGAIFVEELSEVPENSLVIFSAHGVSKLIFSEAKEKNLRVLNATCPLVTKVHLEVARMHEQGYEIVMIGHQGHPEVEGTMGQVKLGIHLVENQQDAMQFQPSSEQLAYVTQTTLSIEDTSEIIQTLKDRFPQIVGPKKDDICYATQNRQDGVKSLSALCDLILVVGSKNSSNSNRLREVAEKEGVSSWLIDSASDIDPAWLVGVKTVGITAGASAPEESVQDVVSYLRQFNQDLEAESMSMIEEDVVFSLPQELVAH